MEDCTCDMGKCEMHTIVRKKESEKSKKCTCGAAGYGGRDVSCPEHGG